MLGISKMRASGGKRLIDRSTPVNVFQQSNTGAFGNNWDATRPTRLSNGWIVQGLLKYSTGYTLYFMVSKDGGATWSQLCYFTGIEKFSFASVGTTIYVCASYGNYCSFCKFDATTKTNINSVSSLVQIIGQNSAGSSVVIGVNPNNKELTMATDYWNGTANGLRMAKSLDEGTTWLKANGTSGYEEIGNTSTTYSFSPITIQYNALGESIVFIQSGYSSSNRLHIYKNLVLWGSNTTHQLGSNIIKLKGSNVGRLYKAHPTTGGTFYIYYSDDGGNTWTQDYSVTATYNGSLVEDKNGDLYFVFRDGSTYTLKIMKRTTSWGAITTLYTGTSGNYPEGVSTCQNYDDFEIPLTIFGSSNVAVSGYYAKFLGKWNE